MIPLLTVIEALPAVPFPRSSPPTRRNEVPARRLGRHVNPVPWLATCVISPCGIRKDWPPGMTPRNFGVLRKHSQCQTAANDDYETYPRTVAGSHHSRLGSHCTTVCGGSIEKKKSACTLFFESKQLESSDSVTAAETLVPPTPKPLESLTCGNVSKARRGLRQSSGK